MLLDQFAQEYAFKSDFGSDELISFGPTNFYSKTSDRLYNMIRNESKTEAMLASALWQMISYTPAYSSFLNKYIVDQRALLAGEQMIINSGGIYSLLVLVPGFQMDRVENIQIDLNQKDAIEANRQWVNSLESKRIVNQSQNKFIHFANAIDPEFLYEISENNPLSVTLASLPEIELTSFLSANPNGVALSQSGSANSTAGAFATDGNGNVGMTVCLHALNSNSGTISSGSKVYIDGNSATISTIDSLSDSCFAVFDDQSIQISQGKGLNGPLQGQSPTQHGMVEFDGLTSGNIKSNIKGWSFEIPFGQPYSQLKVFTDPDTNPGDSGAGLIDDSDNIIGFAFYRTGITQRIQFSSWIWADSVFSAHNIV